MPKNIKFTPFLTCAFLATFSQMSDKKKNEKLVM